MEVQEVQSVLTCFKQWIRILIPASTDSTIPVTRSTAIVIICRPLTSSKVFGVLRLAETKLSIEQYTKSRRAFCKERKLCL